eukprot:CAMPEP_0170584646 /NCGR_PEP_ID=MMETSP0224-20130122/8794_1 /TAXON_ID=285029 /ORGANISM="Togula jolla, Strain CCCM 725" /LENGTH=247 /DNA_ID=CAMNT_0010908083 /DNA_START=110 /DNA_END=853 /DNA_ORIENTATION=+
MAVTQLCARSSLNHLYFAYGGGLDVRPVTRPLLAGAANLAQRYPRMRFHVDAHTGAGAPSGIATATAQRRAQRIMRDLVDRGVEKERLSSLAWGRRASSVWSEPEDDTAARAELFFRLDGNEFPDRPGYYDLVPPEKRPQAGESLQESESSDENDGGARARSNGPTQMLALLHLLRLQRPGPEGDQNRLVRVVSNGRLVVVPNVEGSGALADTDEESGEEETEEEEELSASERVELLLPSHSASTSE